MKPLLILYIVLGLGFLLTQATLIDRRFSLPVFLQHDLVAEQHHSNIQVTVHCSRTYLQEADVEQFKKEYSALWGHLNRLYSTNDVEPGKEYFTENWFRLLCRNKPVARALPVTREDLQHNVHIFYWSTDALVCTLIDSNLIFRYKLQGGRAKDTIMTTCAHIALVLLFEGDHWRIDALRVLNEVPVNNPVERIPPKSGPSVLINNRRISTIISLNPNNHTI